MSKKAAIFTNLSIAVTFIIAIFFVFARQGQTPEDFMQERYKDNPAYEILKTEQSGDYTAYLGKDNEKLSLNLFYKGEWFGEKPITFERRHVLNTIDIYNSSHYDAVTVIFGENLDLMYKSYHMEIASSPISVTRNLRGITEIVDTPKKVTKDIEGEQYVLDIYVLDLMYDGFPDLTFTKVNEPVN